MKNPLFYFAVIGLLAIAFPTGSQQAIRNSATIKLSCNHDGSMNIETVPLNHQ